MNLQQGTRRVNEQSASRVSVTFLDADKVPGAPVSARYRIDDVTYGRGGSRTVLDWTAISPVAATATIDITSAQNSILNDANAVEKRQLTVEATDASGGIYRHGFVFEIDNFAGTT